MQKPTSVSPGAVAWVCKSCEHRLARRLYSTSTSVDSKPVGKWPHHIKIPTLKPLSKPLGIDSIPRPGQNWAKDPRTYKERYRDFIDHDNAKERRRKLMKEISYTYYQDQNRMRFHKGKTYLAPTQLIKSEVAKYMPNLQGYTLNDSWHYHDTTKALSGKTTILTFTCSRWAVNQVSSFMDKKHHPEIVELLESERSRGLQRVRVNLETRPLMAFLVWFFLRTNRKRTPKEDWDRSFFCRKGVHRDTMEKFGMTNLKVGTVLLIDKNCKIRWGANGYAQEDEKESLVRLTKRLLDASKLLKTGSTK